MNCKECTTVLPTEIGEFGVLIYAYDGNYDDLHAITVQRCPNCNGWTPAPEVPNEGEKKEQNMEKKGVT